MFATELTMILWILMGIATSYIANQRGRDPYIWFALGMFFGVLALLTLVLLPQVKAEELEKDERNKEIVERREKQMEEQERIENAPDLEPQSIETKEWFYLDKERQQHGPLSFYVINELWEGGTVNSQTYVWTEGMPEWKRVQEISDLYDILERLDAENRKSYPEDI